MPNAQDVMTMLDTLSDDEKTKAVNQIAAKTGSQPATDAAAPTSNQDSIVVLSVIASLGLFSLGGLFGVIWLLLSTKADVAPLTTLVGSAVGALGALLASTSTRRPPTTPAGR
jgi:hypothetical protein